MISRRSGNHMIQQHFRTSISKTFLILPTTHNILSTFNYWADFWIKYQALQQAWLLSILLPACTLNFTNFIRLRVPEQKSCIQGNIQQLLVDQISMIFFVLLLNPFWCRIHAAKPISKKYSPWGGPAVSANYHNFSTEFSTVLQSLTRPANCIYFFFFSFKCLFRRRCR